MLSLCSTMVSASGALAICSSHHGIMIVWADSGQGSADHPCANTHHRLDHCTKTPEAASFPKYLPRLQRLHRP